MTIAAVGGAVRYYRAGNVPAGGEMEGPRTRPVQAPRTVVNVLATHGLPLGELRYADSPPGLPKGAIAQWNRRRPCCRQGRRGRSVSMQAVGAKGP